MITMFYSLYAGHTDLDNIGYGGTPINERRYSNAHLATALSKAESMATLMDALGYNCFWMAEHHFQREGSECIPNTILMALHLAHRTKNIKIGCGFNITPMWHPLRLAEDFATVDILTGGRIVVRREAEEDQLELVPSWFSPRNLPPLLLRFGSIVRCSKRGVMRSGASPSLRRGSPVPLPPSHTCRRPPLWSRNSYDRQSGKSWK